MEKIINWGAGDMKKKERIFFICIAIVIILCLLIVFIIYTDQTSKYEKFSVNKNVLDRMCHNRFGADYEYTDVDNANLFACKNKYTTTILYI